MAYGFEYDAVQESADGDFAFSEFVLEAANDAAITLVSYHDNYSGAKLRDAVKRGIITADDIINEFAKQIRIGLL